MKKIFCVMLICVLTFSLMACNYRSESLDLAVCGSYAVPGMFCYNLKGGTYSCNVIERDSYGRILFSYKTESVITYEEETVYVICQKYDSNYVYFYEDICYEFKDGEEFDNESLKALNDWDKELDYSKMARRKNTISFDLYIMPDTKLDWNAVKEECVKALDVELSDIYNVCILDYDSDGKELCWLQISGDVNQNYFVIIDLEYNPSFMEVNEKQIDYPQFYEFKKENGWIYGFE